jgi:hypothetical protein
MRRFTRSESSGLWIAGIVGVLFFLFGNGYVIGAEDSHWPLPFHNAGDSIRLVLFVEGDSTDSDVATGSTYRDTTISLDETKHNMLLYKYWPAGETQPLGYVGSWPSVRPEGTDSIWQLPHRLYLGETVDSIQTYLIRPNDSTYDTTYVDTNQVEDSIQVTDTIATRILDLIYIDGNSDPYSMYFDYIPSTRGTPLASTTAAYVSVYIDASTGAVSGGTMVPRTDVVFYLNLMGEGVMISGSWIILQTRYEGQPTAGGRTTWIVPANTAMEPAGSYYELWFEGWDGWMMNSGLVKKFVVDTIVDPLDISTATEVW